MEIHHDVDNPASGRVPAKSGIRETGAVAARRTAPSDSGTHLVWVRDTNDTPVSEEQPEPAAPRALEGGW